MTVSLTDRAEAGAAIPRGPKRRQRFYTHDLEGKAWHSQSHWWRCSQSGSVGSPVLESS